MINISYTLFPTGEFTITLLFKLSFLTEGFFPLRVECLKRTVLRHKTNNKFLFVSRMFFGDVEGCVSVCPVLHVHVLCDVCVFICEINTFFRTSRCSLLHKVVSLYQFYVRLSNDVYIKYYVLRILDTHPVHVHFRFVTDMNPLITRF